MPEQTVFSAARVWVAERPSATPEITDLQHTFLDASEEAETARLGKERQHLEEMAKAQAARAEARTEREIAIKKLSRRKGSGLGWTAGWEFTVHETPAITGYITGNSLTKRGHRANCLNAAMPEIGWISPVARMSAAISGAPHVARLR
ncbi:MAG TPA: hypothetical protein VIH98_07080 [Xanthobacteraceae bacterium]